MIDYNDNTVVGLNYMLSDILLFLSEFRKFSKLYFK